MRFAKMTLVFGLVGLILGIGPSVAGVRKSGITGAAFLKIGVGARAVGLGSAYTTITGDANQIFWNPAGITLDRGRTQVAFTYNQWIADLNHYAAGVTHDFGSLGTWGIGLVGLGLGGIAADRDVVPAFLEGTFTPFDANTSDSYDYQDMALNLSWARNFTDKLSMGVTGKLINQSIDSESANAFAADFGAIYRIGYRGARIGARINNLGSDIEFFDIGSPLPLIFSIGTSINLVDDPSRDMKLKLLVDATKPQDGEQLLYTPVNSRPCST